MTARIFIKARLASASLAGLLTAGCAASGPGTVDPTPPELAITREAGTPPGPAAPSAMTSAPGAGVAASPLAALSGRVWVLEGFGESGIVAPVLVGPQVTMGLAGEQLSGSTGCNSYSATLTPGDAGDHGQAVVISDPVVTLMACEDAAVMAQEGRFLEVLRQVGRIRLTGGGLDSRLVLEPADAQVPSLLFGRGDE